MKPALLFVMLIAIGYNSFTQPRIAKEFLADADGYNIYLYQSLIRVLNNDQNPEFNMLIRNLDHFHLVTTDSLGGPALKTFKEMDKGIQEEGFEQILTLDNKDYNCHIYELSSKKGQTSWIATLYIDGRAGLIEMKGSLDMKYLNAFESFNMEKFRNMIPVQGF